MKKLNIIGVIYPIPKAILDRSLKNSDNVFIKNSVNDKKPIYLDSGSEIWFYVGSPYKKVFARGIIKSIEVISYKELIKKYGKKLMQKEEEIKNYCGKGFIDNLKKKTVYVINNLKSLNEGLNLPFPITMTGRYINKKEYLEIIKHGKKI